MAADPTPDAAPVALAPYALAGAALSATVVVSAGVVGPPQLARPFTTWGGLLAPVGVWPDHDRVPGIVLAASLSALVVLWIALARTVHRSDCPPRSLWMVGTGWLVPLVVGPPILSNDVFSYVAQGAVAARGADPARVSSYALGWSSPLTQAVDPVWRDTPSPYGPIATLVQRALVEAAGGQPVLAVVGLRVVAVGSVLAATLLALSIARRLRPSGRRDGFVVLLVWLNPLVALHVVAAIHLEGVLVMLVLAAVRLAMTGTAAAHLAATVVATGAAAVKLPVGAVVLVVLAGAVLTRPDPVTDRVRRIVATAAISVGAYAAMCAAAGSGWNLLAVISTPSAGRTPAAPATMLATAALPLRWWVGADAEGLHAATRLLCAGLALVAIGFLAVTAGRRSLPASVGLALFALAAGSPVVYPWYLVWSVPLLAAVATGAWRRRLVLGSAVGAVMTVQGLTRIETVVFATSVVTVALVTVWCTERELRTRLRAGVRARVEGLMARRMGTVRE